MEELLNIAKWDAPSLAALSECLDAHITRNPQLEDSKLAELHDAIVETLTLVGYTKEAK